jgi:ABC-2 type transport system ATP-binding protein
MSYEPHVQRTDSTPQTQTSAIGRATAGTGGPTIGLRVEKLGKRFGDLWALRDLDLEVPAGRVLGLLGHNGAGKTTALRILTTLALPTEGRAWVAGHDVVTAAARVRGLIGLAGQYATVDGLLTARANLRMVGRLCHLSSAESQRRADELLERVNLVDAADRLAKDLSGGMRRRLDLAAALVAHPPVLFLDEPTTGLDPVSRTELWTLLRERVRGGATLVLTTQYLEEADRLADDVVVLDHGRIAAQGTPAALKAQLGSERVVVTLTDPALAQAAWAGLRQFAHGEVTIDLPKRQVTVPLRPGVRLVEIVRGLDGLGIEAHDLHRREATLDDVFIAITSASGTSARQEVA